MSIVRAVLLLIAAGTPAARAQTGRDYTDSDARFMRGMIVHHAQAVAMATLVPARSDRRDLTSLAERIAVSQTVEIRMMRRWLGERGELGADGEHQGHALMPGMLTEAELAELVSLTGEAFEHRFLEQMIRHHEGALAMVTELFTAPGGGREPELWEFATDIEAAQRSEVALMRRLLAADRPPGGPNPGTIDSTQQHRVR